MKKTLSESTIRRRLRQMGYVMKRSRRQLDVNNRGGYVLIRVDTNTIVEGEKFDLSLRDVRDWLENNTDTK